MKICPACLSDFTPRSKRHFYYSADCRSSSEFVRRLVDPTQYPHARSAEAWREHRQAEVERRFA